MFSLGADEVAKRKQYRLHCAEMTKSAYEKRAMFKMVAAGSMFGFIAVLNDWNKFAGWNAVERAFMIFVWAFTFLIGPVLVIKLPQKHRLVGWLLFCGALLCILGSVIALAFGASQLAWQWLARAIFAGFGAFVFLLDKDVRRYRSEFTDVPNQADVSQ